MFYFIVKKLFHLRPENRPKILPDVFSLESFYVENFYYTRYLLIIKKIYGSVSRDIAYVRHISETHVYGISLIVKYLVERQLAHNIK